MFRGQYGSTLAGRKGALDEARVDGAPAVVDWLAEGLKTRDEVRGADLTAVGFDTHGQRHVVQSIFGFCAPCRGRQQQREFRVKSTAKGFTRILLDSREEGDHQRRRRNGSKPECDQRILALRL